MAAASATHNHGGGEIHIHAAARARIGRGVIVPAAIQNIRRCQPDQRVVAAVAADRILPGGAAQIRVAAFGATHLHAYAPEILLSDQGRGNAFQGQHAAVPSDPGVGARSCYREIGKGSRPPQSNSVDAVLEVGDHIPRKLVEQEQIGAHGRRIGHGQVSGQRIGPGPAHQRVVPGTADQRVGARLAFQFIVATETFKNVGACIPRQEIAMGGADQILYACQYVTVSMAEDSYAGAKVHHHKQV